MTKDEIIEDVHRMIMKEWSDEDKNSFFVNPYKDHDSLYLLHHGFGTWIRNHYKLWELKWEPELRDGVDYSPNHPDAISMTIIKEVWKKGLSNNGQKS